MRKLLIFLTLVGVGLGLLLWLEQRGRPTNVEPEPDPAPLINPEAGPTPGDSTPGAGVGSQGTDDDDPRHAAINGWFEHNETRRTTGPDGNLRNVPLWRIATTLTPRNRGLVVEYDAENVDLEIFDPETGDSVRRARAEGGRFTLDLTQVRQNNFTIADDGRVELFGLRLDQDTGLPFTPVKVTADHGEVFIDRQEFRSLGDGVVLIEGSGLDGEGRGVVLDGEAGSMVFERGGEVRLLDANGRAGLFATRPEGDLRVQRMGDPAEGKIEAVANRGGHLEVREPSPDDPTQLGPPFVMDADVLRVEGRVDNQSGVSEIHRALGTGNVVAVLGRDTCRGGVVEAVFDPAGVVDHLLVEDEPRLEVDLIDVDGIVHRIVASGAGPLRAWTTPDGRSHFELQGPATITDELEGLTIFARERITGWTSEDGTTGEFNGRGEVVLTQGASRVETAQVLVTFRATEEAAALAICSGVTHLELQSEEGTRFNVDATEELHLALAGDRWTVPYASGVTGSSLEPDPFAIAAPLVRDLDWVDQSFVAEGGVVWSGELGQGTADRVVAIAVDDVELFGTETLPAHLLYRSPHDETPPILATFDAEHLHARQGGVEAWRRVRAIVTDDPNLVDPTLPTRPPLAADRTLFDLTADHVRLDVTYVEGQTVTPFTLVADEVERLDRQQPLARTILSCPRLDANGTFVEGAAAPEEGGLQLERLVASGGVEFDHQGAFGITGAGQRLILEGLERARIEVDPVQRVYATGLLPGTEIPFRVEADWIEATADRLEASNGSLEIQAPLAPMGLDPLPFTGRTTVVAEHLIADPNGVQFTGDVHLRTADEAGVDVELRAGRASIQADTAEELEGRPWNEVLRTLTAEDGFRVAYGGLLRARGERLLATPTRFSMWGAPVTVESLEMWIDTSFIELDLETFLIRTGPGVMRGGEGGATWALEFTELHPIRRGPDEMLVFVQPVLQEFDRTVRADFASMWIHPDQWRAAGREALFGETYALELGPPPGPPAIFPANDLIANVFRDLEAGKLTRLARAIYLEGDVELDQRGYRVARTDGVYLDLEHRRGWLENVELSYDMEVGSETHRVRTKSERMVSTGSGSLHAERATLTACSHDEPHYWIETTNLNLVPRDDGLWVISLRNNNLKFGNGWRLPLPSIGNIALNDRGGLEGIVNDDGDVTTIDGLILGTSARFGTTIGTRGTVDAGDAGKTIAGLFGFHDHVRGKWKYEGRWMNSRGPLLGLGLLLREKAETKAEEEDFWLDLWARGIPDEGDDRGIFRVPTEDRPEFRSWLHMRGRYPFSDQTWINLVFNTQTDAAVQSEFFQQEFLSYEERDTYLHGRKAIGADYLSARMLLRVDDFRTVIEERPTVGAYRGPRTAFDVFGKPVHYDATADVASLRRREGLAPFERPLVGIDGLPDGLGEREVLRADTAHTLRMPLDTGVGPVRATPYVQGRFTAWDQGQVDGEDPARGALFGGLEISASWLAQHHDGSYLTVSPVARFQDELAYDATGDPVRFDALEDPIDGRRIEAGFRSIWRRPGAVEQLDLELTASELSDRRQGVPDATQGAVLAHYRNSVFDMPFVVRTDTRYDFESERTPYSRSLVSVRPSDDLILLATYTQGRDPQNLDPFQATGVRARYRVDTKWELEAATSFSLRGDESLFNEFTLRRYSHDFILELIVDFRRGEGAGVRMNLAPLLGWSRAIIGVLDDPR